MVAYKPYSILKAAIGHDEEVRQNPHSFCNEDLTEEKVGSY